MTREQALTQLQQKAALLQAPIWNERSVLVWSLMDAEALNQAIAALRGCGLGDLLRQPQMPNPRQPLEVTPARDHTPLLKNVHPKGDGRGQFLPRMADDTLAVEQAKRQLLDALQLAVSQVRCDSSAPVSLRGDLIDALIAAVRADTRAQLVLRESQPQAASLSQEPTD